MCLTKQLSDLLHYFFIDQPYLYTHIQYTWASLVAQMGKEKKKKRKNCQQCRGLRFDPWVRKIL